MVDRHRILLGAGAVLAVLAVLAAVLFQFASPVYWFFAPTEYSTADPGLSIEEVEHDVVAEDLSVPWEVLVLDTERFLVTERTGDLVLFDGGDRVVVQEFEETHTDFLGEGGLLGMDVHPDFEENQYLYIYMTVEDAVTENQVVRYRFDADDASLTDETMILDGIPSDRIHNGGRIAFGPDGYLYVTTGDAAEAELAQDRGSLAGKILRVTDEGEVPDDNPFENEVYSYGHRNAQGITWADDGTLWSSEHGPTARDELNLIEPGLNYGWPNITGAETHPGMETAVKHSGTDDTWAPAGAAYHDGSVFFAGLRGEGLFQAVIEDDEVVGMDRHFGGELGRMRAVTLGPDDALYVSTSNTDGRGIERDGDDRIVRIPADQFS